MVLTCASGDTHPVLGGQTLNDYCQKSDGIWYSSLPRPNITLTCPSSYRLLSDNGSSDFYDPMFSFFKMVCQEYNPTTQWWGDHTVWPTCTGAQCQTYPPNLPRQMYGPPPPPPQNPPPQNPPPPPPPPPPPQNPPPQNPPPQNPQPATPSPASGSTSSPSPLVLSPTPAPTPLIPVATTPTATGTSITLPENLQFLTQIPWWGYLLIVFGFLLLLLLIFK